MLTRQPKSRSLASKKTRSPSLRRTRRRVLQLELLAQRELLAANVMDDTINLAGSEVALNVLTNDTNGSEVQNVSAFNADYDRATYPALRGSNDTDWFIPERPGQPGVPQRSLIVGAVLGQDGRPDPAFNGGGNNGDIDLLRDNDADPSNDIDLTDADDGLDIGEGMILATLRENFSVASLQPFNEPLGTNVGVIQYQTEGGPGGNTWIAQAAGPENNGERSSYFGAAFFPYDAGWTGASFNSAGTNTSGSADIQVTGTGGRYMATVAGVTDSFNDGFMFAIGGDNEDNYTRVRPVAGGEWEVQHRDNAAEIGGAEGDDFNLMYFPRDAQGLIGGVVSGASAAANPMLQSFGEFNIVRETDGFWRLSVPGHSPTSGVLVMETYDQTGSAPRNSYFSYVQADTGNTDDFIIRQFTWDSNAETPQNLDFAFFFVPFENTMNPSAPLTVNSVGTDASPTGGVSEQGIALGINPDSTINYQVGDAIAALAEGQTATDTFIYEATDGLDTGTATVTVNWIGVNDAPTVVSPIPNQDFVEDEAPRVFDLSTHFEDVDNGSVLTYTVDPGAGGFLNASVNGSDLTLGPAANRFGITSFSVTATDETGLSVSFSVEVSISTADDDPVAVDDNAQTDKVTAIDIPAIDNDFHPDTGGFGVAAAEIFGNPDATGNGDTVWNVVASSAAPNELTIQSAPNRGDVAIGRNGIDLFQSDGVLVGTVRDNVTPYQTVNTYAAFGSYGFATDTGIGGGERNSPLSAGFFPYTEGWISGQVAADGDVISGVGISDANVTKLGTGLWELTIPGMDPGGAFFDSGMVFVMSGSNDDNIMSVYPQIGGGWLVGQRDSDVAVGIGGEWNGEDDAWSFVYIPSSAPDLIAGQFAVNEEGGGGFVNGRNYGGASAIVDGFGAEASVLLSIPGYTPAEGALIAISSGSELGVDPVSGVVPPAAKAVMATPDGNDFRIQAFNAADYSETAEDFYFVFLPFDQPLQRQEGLDISITSVAASSALGAAVSINPDGTIKYDPTVSANPAITGLLPGQSVEDTFTYTIQDSRTPAGGDTGVVTITVTGQNQAPTANDDVININEISAQNASLTLTGNDTDPDFGVIFGTPTGIPAANLSVNAGVWSVANTGTGANEITLGATATGSVEVLGGGAAITQNDGVVIATIRENAAQPDFSVVQSISTPTNTTLAISEFDADNPTDAQVALSYFRFADNWVGGHVDGLGGLIAGSGVAGTDIVRTATGRYEVTIPGITDADQDGFLLAIGSDGANADNVVSVQPQNGTNKYLIGVRDNSQDFGDGEDGGFSFVFIPRTAENLIAGSIDRPAVANALTSVVGEFSTSQPAPGEWLLTIPGQTPATGMLLLSNDDTTQIEDNFLSYQDDGNGNFVIRGHDMPNLGTQGEPISFVFIPFDAAVQPVYRPVPSPLMVSLPSSTSALGANLTINADGTVNYDPGTIHDALYAGDTAIDTFSYTADDGFGGTSNASVTINILGFGEAVAVLNTAGATQYGLGDNAIGIDSFLTLTDSDTPFLDGAQVEVSVAVGGLATDELGIRNEGTGTGQVGVSGADVSFEGTVIGTFAGGTGGTPLTLTLNSSATLDNLQAVLRAVTFANTDAATPMGARSIQFALTDQNGRTSAAGTKELVLTLLRTYNLQQGVDYGYGSYLTTEDVNLLQASPDGIPATDDHLIDYNASGAEAQSLLKFGDIFGTNPGQIPADATIISADLILDTNTNFSANAPGDGARFLRMLTDWDESATWNSLSLDTFGATYDEWGIRTNGTQARMEFDSWIGTETNASSTGTGSFALSVLPDVVAWQGGEANFGWVFKGWENQTDGWFFSSSENANAAFRPRLVIDWAPASEVNFVSFQDGANGYDGTVDTQIGPGSGSGTDNSLAETLFVDYQSATDNGVQALVRFEDIIGDMAGQIPAGSQIISAQLTTTSVTSNAMGDGGTFNPILVDWADTDTYDSLVDGLARDDVDAQSTFTAAAGNASRAPNVQGGRHSWDVTADLQAWVDGAIGNRGWAISPWVSGTDGWGFQSSEDPDIADRPQLQVMFIEGAADAIAPGIDNIYVGSTDWSAAFIDEVDDVGGKVLGSGNGFGYELSGADAALPWDDLNTFYVQFSEDVQNVVDANIELRDSTGVVPATVIYDPGTFLATITVGGPLTFNKYRLGVNDLVTDLANNPLDGDGDGSAGGIFDVRLDVNPGDGNRDGRVNGTDFASFTPSFLAQVGQAAYNPFVDWNADDRVNGSDFAVFSPNFLNNIGTLAEPAAAFSGGGGGGEGEGESSNLSGFDSFFAGFGDDDEEEEDDFLLF